MRIVSIGGKVNYYFTGILIILITLLALFGGPAHSGSTQTNVSGSNTAIEGGYTSESTTTYETGSESSSTTTILQIQILNLHHHQQQPHHIIA